VLAFAGDSQVVMFEGSFEAREEHGRERLGAEAEWPHRTTARAHPGISAVDPGIDPHRIGARLRRPLQQ
jgi:hypothetical protein